MSATGLGNGASLEGDLQGRCGVVFPLPETEVRVHTYLAAVSEPGLRHEYIVDAVRVTVAGSPCVHVSVGLDALSLI